MYEDAAGPLLRALKLSAPKDFDRAHRAILAGWERGMLPAQALADMDDMDLLEQATWLHLGFQTIEVSAKELDMSAFTRLPIHVATEYQFAPVEKPFGQCVVVADPGNVGALDAIREHLGQVKVFASDADTIAAILRVAADRIDANRIANQAGTLVAERTRTTQEPEEESASDSAMASFVDALLRRGIMLRASDIHVDPGPKELSISYRVDGILQPPAGHDKTITGGVVNRIKIMAGMDVGETRRPQDGRFPFYVDGRTVDMRAALLPSIWGESVALRILDSATGLADLDHLGFHANLKDRIKSLVSQPAGAVIATGPMGAGKSTTLYAALRHIASFRRVVTIEDPVEYKIAGVHQHQVDPARDFTFATALRAFVRADAEAMLVGEIRDKETAHMAMDAAFTGHLVLSSFHARSAAAAPVRLIEMGVAPHLVSSGLTGVLGQRLVRKLCPDCKERDNRDHARLPWPGGEVPKRVYKSRHGGCEKCNATGYLGRTVVGELLEVTEEVASAIAANSNAGEILAVAKAEGMLTLLEDGLHMVSAGVTSIDEIQRAVGGAE